MTFSVSHYSGCGNSFLLLDNQKLWFPKESKELILQICKTAQVDGLILVEKSADADFQMRFFNNDATEASMCGNGIRCMGRYLKDKLQVNSESITIQAKERTLKLTFVADEIKVDMGDVVELGFDIFLSHEGKEFVLHHLDTGVPHVVVVVEDVDAIDVEKVGAYFRWHERFQPQGANVNFVEIVSPTAAKIRTFERGCETETLACGTGAVASSYALSKTYRLKVPMKLQVRSNEFLKVDIQAKKATLQGAAKWVRDGKFDGKNLVFNSSH